jgi:gluconate 5-dehydrogenase
MPSVNTLFRLAGKTALITGASRGLGQEIAEGLGEAGANLFIVARREQWLNTAIKELQEQGLRCEGCLCNVADPAQVKTAFERAIATYGGVDILINNAGTTWGAPAENMPLDKWQAVINVNLTGAFLFSQECARSMIARGQGGVILNIASIAGLRGSLPRGIHCAGYVASKGGLIALTRELAAKWAPYGIRVNCIAPGFFPTRMTEAVLPRMEEDLRVNVPMARAGRSGEIKGAAVFLTSEASSYITGQTIVVDGGATIIAI